MACFGAMPGGIVQLSVALLTLGALACSPPDRAPPTDIGVTAALDSGAAATEDAVDYAPPDASDATKVADDAETPDAASADAEPADAEPADTEPADAEPADAEPTDAEPTDAETPVTTTPDTTTPDTTTPDTTTPDDADASASTPDIGATDTALTDVSTPDTTHSSDTGAPPETSTTDATSTADAADAADAGPADAGPAPLWPADAWTGPAQPLAQNKLPKAAFTDITASFGFSAKSSWAYCAAAGFIDGDAIPDVVLIELIGGGATGGGATSAKIQALRGGANPTLVSSPLNTSLLFPNGGCALADLSGDGFDDLVIGGSAGLAYYLGDGSGKFTDASAARLPSQLPAKVWSIAVDDFDGDGRLDLYLGAGKPPNACNGLNCSYTQDNFTCLFPGTDGVDSFDDDRLLLQQPSGGFKDVTSVWKPAKGGLMTSVASYDVNDDGYPDVLVGDDFGGHALYLNQAGKSFSKAVKPGFLPYAHAMGWGVGDLNGDGATDLTLADLGPVQVYAGHPGKAPPGQLAGPYALLPVGNPVAGATWKTSTWVPQVGDLDHDGDLDLYLGVAMYAETGFLQFLATCQGMPTSYGGADLWLRNDGGFAFTPFRVAPTACGRVEAVPQSLVDLDGDGDLDIIQIRPGCSFEDSRIRVLRNDLTKAGGAVVVRLVGPKGNRDAIGARLNTTVAGEPVSRRIVGGVGIGSSGARRIHLGLGKATTTGPITVTWPDGKQTKHAALKAGSAVTWTYP